MVEKKKINKKKSSSIDKTRLEHANYLILFSCMKPSNHLIIYNTPLPHYYVCRACCEGGDTKGTLDIP